MENIRAIVIDDEEDSVNFIKSIIDEFCPEVNVVETANSVNEGVTKIKDYNPDIVFLDVEMPNGTGFDLLERFSTINFDVIFITAYNHYAIKAIKYSAVDYILKPISIEELIDAVKKVIQNKNEKTHVHNYDNLINNLKSSSPQKLAIPTRLGLQYIDTNNIIRIEADRSYSNVHIQGQKKIMVSRNLVEFQELLQSQSFFRCWVTLSSKS